MEDKYLQDISDIKNMMNKSSQFISLSGLAGVLAGIYALIGACIAKQTYNNFFQNHDLYQFDNYRNYLGFSIDKLTIDLLIIAIVVLAASIITAFVLTYFKAKKQGETILNSSSKRLAINFLIPLTAGGIFALLLLRHQVYFLIAPITLIFYGLACVNASKYTFRDVRYLGITLVILGLFCTEYPQYGLYFWALGFGVCHIVYGGLMWFKYDRSPLTPEGGTKK